MNESSKIKRFPRRAVHMDFHTMPKVDDVGAEFNGKEFAQTLKNAHIDSVTVFAKCNLGFAYYPTKVGIPHPGLQCDLLGEMVKACHEEDIMVLAYFNAGLDHENALHHRDWCVLPADGTIYKEDRLNPFFRRMCLNTEYGNYLVKMVNETIELYDVDGLFFDCFNPLEPCYGIECLEMMEKHGADIMDPVVAKEALSWTNAAFASRIRAITPEDKLLYFNCVPFKEQVPYCGHFEIECLPQGEWGYDNFPANVRYTRNLGPYTIGQTGRFQGGWGDFGGIRTEESLRFDCYHAISNAVACGIGDHIHPRGKLEPEVYNIIGNIYGKIEELEPWLADVKAVTEIGVVIPQNAMGYPITNWESVNHPVAAAVRMLTELKYQVDVIDWDMDFSKYKVLVLPDNVFVPSNCKDKLNKYIKSGGGIISTGHSGLTEDKTTFALPESWGIVSHGEETFNMEFFETSDSLKDIAGFPVSIYKPGISISANKGTEVLAYINEPYFNKHWDGYHGYYYVPPKTKTAHPALTRNGNVFQFSFPIFQGYYEHAYVIYKKIIKNCIEKILPEPLIKTEGLPSFARITMTEKDHLTMIHILSYVPEMRGKKQIIEEPVCLNNVKISFRTDGAIPQRVFSAPDMKPLEYSLDNEYMTMNIPKVNGYKLIVLEGP